MVFGPQVKVLVLRFIFSSSIFYTFYPSAMKGCWRVESSRRCRAQSLNISDLDLKVKVRGANVDTKESQTRGTEMLQV